MFKSMDLSLVQNNLTDQDYLAGGQEGAYYLGAERTATVTLKLDF
jgi:iron complex outermembrane receptor protein